MKCGNINYKDFSTRDILPSISNLLLLCVFFILIFLTVFSIGFVSVEAASSATTYKISYKKLYSADNSANPKSYTQDTATITLKAPTRKGYDFVGWYSNSSLTKQVTQIKKGSTGNKTFYAKWKAHKYTVKFYGNGADAGSMASLKNCKYGSEYIIPNCTFTKDGYHFTGWNTKADGSGTGYTAGEYAKNLTSKSGATVKLYAQWEPGIRTGRNSIINMFNDNEGRLIYAYAVNNTLYIAKTDAGKVSKRVKISFENSIGNVICDSDGNYYVVTYKDNPKYDADLETLFISKYTGDGELIISKGYPRNGVSSFGSFDLAVNDEELTLYYNYLMFPDGFNIKHQGDQVFTVKKNNLEKTDTGRLVGSSHSFAPRAAAFSDSFVYSTMGDGYPRAFTLDVSGAREVSTNGIFHFWVEEDTLSNYQKDYDSSWMLILNDCYASMGDIITLDGTSAALVAASVPSMDYNADYEKYGLFIQVFDTAKDLETEEAYITTGERVGFGTGDGNIPKLDFGVKWLSLSDNVRAGSVLAAKDGKGHIIIAYKKTYTNAKQYNGMYYMITDYNGNIIVDETKWFNGNFSTSGKRGLVNDGNFYILINDSDGYYNLMSLDINKALAGKVGTKLDKSAADAADAISNSDSMRLLPGTELSLSPDQIIADTWTSSNSSTVSVTTKGVIKAIKTGSAQISAQREDGSTYTCEVEVINFGIYEKVYDKRRIESIVEASIILNTKDVKEITVPEGTKRLDNAFLYGNKKLTKVTLPSTLTEIGDAAFTGCKSLQTLTIPDSVKTIGKGIVRNCTKLKTLVLSTSVYALPPYTFAGCTALTDYSIPEHIRRINTSAFKDCTGLTSIKIPDYKYNGLILDMFAFSGCMDLSNLDLANVTNVYSYAFNQCISLKEINAPQISMLHEGVFRGCVNLETLLIPKVMLISEQALANCKNLTTFVFAQNDGYTVSVDDNAFRGCSKLKEIVIRGNISYDLTIGNHAFDGCTALERFEYPTLAPVTRIGEGAFYNCSSLKSFKLPYNLEEFIIKPYTFYGCSALTSVTAPTLSEMIEKVYTPEYLENYYGLYDQYEQDDFISRLEDTVYTAGEYAFYKCSNLSNINFPVKAKDYSFYGTALNNVKLSVYLSDGVGRYAFAECRPLQVVEFDSFPENIGAYAFYNTSLHTINTKRDPQIEAWYPGYYESLESQQSFALYVGEHAFTGTMMPYSENSWGVTKHLRTNVSAVDKDKSNVIISNGVTTIEDYALYKAYGVTGITIPGTVTSIGAYAFSDVDTAGWDGQTIGYRDEWDYKFIIPEGVTYIGQNAFSNMSAPRVSLYLPNSVAYIGPDAFSNIFMYKIYVHAGSYAERYLLDYYQSSYRDFYGDNWMNNESVYSTYKKYVDEKVGYY